MKYSALVTCITECTVQVEAASDTEARTKIERGEFLNVALYDGGLDMPERFHQIEMEPDSFGVDS